MKFKNDKERHVIELMIKHGKIPSEGTFEIDQSLISMFNKIYISNFVDSRAIYASDVSASDVRYGEKLAGLSLLRLLKSRVKPVIKTTKEKISSGCGFVYIVSNPAFEGFYKIGMTKDMNARLSSYQTYDPHRKYKLEHYKFVENARQSEREFLTIFSIDLAKGEWISPKDFRTLQEVFFD